MSAVPAELSGSIEVSERGAALVLTLTGELDLATRPSIERALGSVTTRAASVVIDLEGVTFCDSSGLRALIAAHSAATESGATFAVRNAPPAVRRLFEITGVDETIKLLP